MKFYRFHPDYDNLFILVPLSGSKFNYHGHADSISRPAQAGTTKLNW